jgi:hypothetical protein
MESVPQPHIKSRESKRFGLELSIINRLCRRYGWELDIERKPWQGSRMNILWEDISKI